MSQPHRREPSRADRSLGPADLTVEVAGRSGPRTVIRVAGRLDARVAPTLARQLADAARSPRRGPPRVALDLSGVTYIDVVGLQVLLDAQDRLMAESGELELLSPTAAVVRLLHEAHLHGTSATAVPEPTAPAIARNGSSVVPRVRPQFH